MITGTRDVAPFTRTVQLLEHEFLVTEREFDDSEVLGHASIHTNTITLKEDIPVDSQHSTLLHEIVHLIIRLAGMKDMSEEDVDAMATGMLSLIRNNAELLGSIIMKEDLLNIARGGRVIG